MTNVKRTVSPLTPALSPLRGEGEERSTWGWKEWHKYWVDERVKWYESIGLGRDVLDFYWQKPEELAHYAKACTDLLYRFFPEREDEVKQFDEVEGIANRTDYDRRHHSEASGEDLMYFDQETEERYFPYVVEPAVGVDRALLVFLLDAYREEQAPTAKGGTDTRTVLGLHRDLAPVKVAVLPLSRNEALVPEAKRVHELVQPEWITQYDDAGRSCVQGRVLFGSA